MHFLIFQKIDKPITDRSVNDNPDDDNRAFHNKKCSVPRVIIRSETAIHGRKLEGAV